MVPPMFPSPDGREGARGVLAQAGEWRTRARGGRTHDWRGGRSGGTNGAYIEWYVDDADEPAAPTLSRRGTSGRFRTTAAAELRTSSGGRLLLRRGGASDAASSSAPPPPPPPRSADPRRPRYAGASSSSSSSAGAAPHFSGLLGGVAVVVASDAIASPKPPGDGTGDAVCEDGTGDVARDPPAPAGARSALAARPRRWARGGGSCGGGGEWRAPPCLDASPREAARAAVRESGSSAALKE